MRHKDNGQPRRARWRIEDTFVGVVRTQNFSPPDEGEGLGRWLDFGRTPGGFHQNKQRGQALDELRASEEPKDMLHLPPVDPTEKAMECWFFQ